MSKNYVFTSESVTEGHPDKVCDAISDAVLDACLEQDPLSRVACETYVKGNLLVIGGEITTKAEVDYNALARSVIREIGYVYPDHLFSADRVIIINAITRQSPDIARGVDATCTEVKREAEQGAGDQGLMFGYATDETPELMPAPILYAHRLCKRLAELRRSGRVEWLRPDGKSQVSVEYQGDRPVRITNVVVSTQHADGLEHKTIVEFVIEEVIKKTLPSEMIGPHTRFLVNPTGRFVLGGPDADTGLTGRKIIVDSYGGMGRHGGGCFSGKDPSKVDRSAAYMARYVAKNIVAAGIARKVEIQFSYAIGIPDPLNVSVDTFGTALPGLRDEDIERAVREVFDFRPRRIIEQLNLLRPIYRKTTNYGHFGKDDPDLTWELTDRVNDLRTALKL